MVSSNQWNDATQHTLATIVKSTLATTFTYNTLAPTFTLATDTPCKLVSTFTNTLDLISSFFTLAPQSQSSSAHPIKISTFRGIPDTNNSIFLAHQYPEK